MLTAFTLLLSFRCGKCNTSPLSLLPSLAHYVKLFTNPEEPLENRAHGEMIPHEVTGSLAEIKCDFPFIRLKSEPARQ